MKKNPSSEEPARRTKFYVCRGGCNEECEPRLSNRGLAGPKERGFIGLRLLRLITPTIYASEGLNEGK